MMNRLLTLYKHKMITKSVTNPTVLFTTINYIMTLIFSNTNTSRSYLTCDIVKQIAQFNRVKPSDYHQFNKTNRKVLSNIRLASFFNP